MTVTCAYGWRIHPIWGDKRFHTGVDLAANQGTPIYAIASGTVTTASYSDANGYNVSALCGKEFLKNTVSGMSYTGSYWLSAVPFAAGIACINKMKKLDLVNELNKKGQLLKDGLIDAGKKYGYDLKVSGALALPYLRITNDDSLIIHQAWIAECVKRGVFFTNHHNHFINAALSEADIKETIDVADEAFKVIKEMGY